MWILRKIKAALRKIGRKPPTLEAAVKPRLLLKIGGREHMVEYKLPNVIKAEAAIGKSLKTVLMWAEMDLGDVPKVLHAGITPEVPLEEIEALCNEAGLEVALEIRHALTCLNFPKFMERLAKRMMEGPHPNAQSGEGS